MSLWQFRPLLASRQLPVHSSLDDLEDEVETLDGVRMIEFSPLSF